MSRLVPQNRCAGEMSPTLRDKRPFGRRSAAGFGIRIFLRSSRKTGRSGKRARLRFYGRTKVAIVLDALTNGDLRDVWRRYFVEDIGCEVKFINCTAGYTPNRVEL